MGEVILLSHRSSKWMPLSDVSSVGLNTFKVHVIKVGVVKVEVVKVEVVAKTFISEA
jgi:hypothetical protein